MPDEERVPLGTAYSFEEEFVTLLKKSGVAYDLKFVFG